MSGTLSEKISRKILCTCTEVAEGNISLRNLSVQARADISFLGNGQTTRLKPTAHDRVFRKRCCAPLVMVNINGPVL